MASRIIRQQRVDEIVLEQYELPPSALWAAYEDGFVAMFHHPETETAVAGQTTSAVRLYTPGAEEKNWDWYVSTRLSVSGGKGESLHAEEALFDRLYGETSARLVYLHGHTGVGKSTFLSYFFSEYIPRRSAWSTEDLRHFVPTKVPLAFPTAARLEEQWDEAVYEYLYAQFAELEEMQFLRNLARHISYPRDGSGRHLRREANGELGGVGYSEKFVQDVEGRIHQTLKHVDKASVHKWLQDEISTLSSQSAGELLNRPVIQVLSEYYGYRFTFVVDNIDDLPSEIQTEVCRLIHAKMLAYYPYPGIRFVISTRDNFLEPVYTQTFPASQGFHEHLFELAPLPFADVLRARKGAFFDPIAKGTRGQVYLDAAKRIGVRDIDGFIDSVALAFNNTDTLVGLHRLANHNVRVMLDLVKLTFQSPHLTKGLLADVATAATHAGAGNRAEVAGAFVAENRILDAVVRGRNALVEVRGKSLLPNVFDSGSERHYSSTLTRLFVMALVWADGVISYPAAQDILSALGHPEQTVTAAISDLLRMKVVFCSRGFLLHEAPEERAKQTLEHRDLPLLGSLLEEVAGALRYMQAVAYVTPLESQFLGRVVVPSTVGDEVTEFRSRVAAASALYDQVRADLRAQLGFIAASSDRARLERICGRYGFVEVVDNIRATAVRHFNNIQSQHLKAGMTAAELFPRVIGRP
jgi:hypothetical protein